MKKMFIVLLCAGLLMSVFVMSVYATTVDDRLDLRPATSNDVDITDEQIVVDYSEQITEYCKDLDKALTKEQIEGIAQLYHDQNINPTFTRLPYQEGVITGEVDLNAPKLNLTAVKDIIAKSDNFEEIMSEIRKIQKFPDVVSGSGVSICIYDFNEYEGIKIYYESQAIIYQLFNADGTLKLSEMLFE